MEQPFPEHTKCPISDSPRLEPLKGYEKHYLVKSIPAGFVFCSRIPTPDELLEYYDKYPRQTNCPPAVRLRYRELLMEFEPWRKTNKILDVGCGEGFFLEEAQKLGWEVHGTEYSVEASELCRKKNIEVKCGMLNEAWYPESFFDVVTSFEVIEHINNPLEMAGVMKKMVRSGGLLYITTPNFNALSRLILKDRYNIIEYPEHLCYYTPRTLNYLFAGIGLNKRKVSTTGISLSRFRKSLQQEEPQDSSRHIENKADSTDSYLLSLGQRNIVFRVIMTIANFFLNILGIGSSLKGWYVKP